MATKQEFSQFIALLVRAIPRFAPAFDPPTVAVWYDAYGADTDLAELEQVFRKATDTCTEFPSIAKLKELAGRKPQSLEDAGRDVAERIYASLTRGWASSLTAEVQARRDAYVGPIGVEVVRQQGGWLHLSDVVQTKEAVGWKSQWRGLAEVIARRGPSQLDHGPQWDRLEKPRPEILALLKKMPRV